MKDIEYIYKYIIVLVPKVSVELALMPNSLLSSSNALHLKQLQH